MDPSEPIMRGFSERRLPEEKFLAQAELLANGAAFAAFKEAAFNDDLWQQAEADPRTYFENLGVEIPEVLDIHLQSHQSMIPWPPTIPELQLVTIRCWWVWGKVDDDEEPAKPFLFCLEVPTILLQYLRPR